jgi:tetratricopeptide (TPR) repeat protein
VSNALFTLGCEFWDEKRLEEAQAHFEEVISRYGSSSEPYLQSMVAGAFINLGGLLQEQGRSKAAQAHFEEVVRRHGKPSTPTLKERVATALNCLISLLADEKHFETSRPPPEEMVQWLGEAPDAELRELMGGVLNAVGFSLLREAKRHLRQEGPEAGRSTLKRAEAKLAEALRFLPEEPLVLGNMAYVAFLFGRRDEACSLIEDVIRRGGEPLRQTSLEDTELYPLPADEEWREIIRGVPVEGRGESTRS